MKTQEEKTMKVELTFKYWLSEDGQLSGEKPLNKAQSVSGEIEVPVSILKNLLRGDGSISHIELEPGRGQKYEGLYFDGLQAAEVLYERYINFPKEKAKKHFQESWDHDRYEIPKFLANQTVRFNGLGESWANQNIDCNELIEKLIVLYADYLTDEQKSLLRKEVQRRKDVIEAERKQQREKQADQEAEKARIEVETSKWIEKHGSDRLKTMYDRGYEYKLTYEVERGELEIPGFVYDKEGKAVQLNDRANPSELALKYETEYIKKYGKDRVSINWGYENIYDEMYGWHAGDEVYSELIWVKPEWSRQGFALFL